MGHSVSESTGPERDGAGQFVKGNCGGPGRRKDMGPEYREAIARAVSPRDVEAIVQVLKREALLGKRWAVIYMLDRLLGKPRESVQMELNADTRGVVHLDIGEA